MIYEKIKNQIKPGDRIKKPFAKKDFIVKGFGKRKGEEAFLQLSTVFLSNWG